MMDCDEVACDLENSSEVVKNYEPRLNQEWVQILINLRMKYSKCFTRKRNSAADAWKNILQEMIELGAPPHVTLEKIKKKWMNLIARYKHLKFTSNLDMITWPYFEQIDRAYARNPSIVELRKTGSKKGSESDESVSDYAEYMMRKQKFTSILIQLRYAYRHLFTGKKFAAQKGWMVIQNLLPNGQSYTIEQISKCWQNLIQRYKTLLENEKDAMKITWVHFQSMHEIMTKKDDETASHEMLIKTETNSPSTYNSNNVIENENDENGFAINETSSDIVDNSINTCLEIKYDVPIKKRKKQTNSLNELLAYFTERDQKMELQHKEMMDVLGKILKQIEK